MALKINLKGGDSLLVATSKFTVASEGYTTIIIEGDLPVMRESESVRLEDTHTPWARICYHVQQHYLTGEPEHSAIVERIGEALDPDDRTDVADILELMDSGQSFKALKTAKRQAGL